MTAPPPAPCTCGPNGMCAVDCPRRVKPGPAPTLAWAAFFDDRIAGHGVWRRAPIFKTKKDAKQWARGTAFRIARVRITEIEGGAR